jgi:hypothetical protein
MSNEVVFAFPLEEIIQDGDGFILVNVWRLLWRWGARKLETDLDNILKGGFKPEGFLVTHV